MLKQKATREQFLKNLNQFLGEAGAATYASGIGGVLEDGYIKLRHARGDWSYEDRYTGYFRSWGHETVFHKGKPVWAQTYGGGMEEKYIQDKGFAHETFEFLKKALSSGEKQTQFQPRGQNSFKDGDWEYRCSMSGDISKFKGSEEIRFKGEKVFTHDFVGGLILSKD